jgi:hypothetical protein
MTQEQLQQILTSNSVDLPSGVKSITLEMEIKRGDTGKIEKYGLVSARHKNKIIHVWLQLYIKIRGLIRQWRQ